MSGTIDDLHEKLNNLRRAGRALAGVTSAEGVFDGIRVEDMRRVLIARGWFLHARQPWGQPERRAVEVYDHQTARGCDPYSIVKCVRVPLYPDWDWHSRVHDWATATASRHGDVSAAEILAEAM